jgi:23S rRNA (cytosine1962-C5)-methyltransferase
MTKELLYSIIFEAGELVKKNIRICRELSAPEDHPYSFLHPEGNYLKGLIVYVD